jgi:methionyl-tRNA formyltransferase
MVITRADKRRGRGGAMAPSPVAAAAHTLGVPVSHAVDDVLSVGASLGVVVAFGQIIKPHVLAALPMVNVHFSLLPRWRGAAPVERAIMAGDDVTGVCVMAVEEGLDTGGVYAVSSTPISETDTAASLRDRLVAIGTSLLVATLAAPLGTPTPQEGEPVYAQKVTVDDLRLDWSQPATVLARLPRVGRAWTEFRGKRLLVHQASVVDWVQDLAPGELAGTVVGTADGGLQLLVVQPEGRAPLDAAAWRNGARPAPGERLG